MKAAGTFLQHSAGQGQREGARRRLLEYAEACKRPEHAVKRIFVDAGLLCQRGDWLLARRQSTGNIKLEDDLQCGRGHVARADLIQELCRGFLG